MISKEEIKLEIAATDLKASQLRAIYNLAMLRPSNMLSVRVFLDGSKWVCIYDTHEELLKCPMAYGESPKQATENFDRLWAGDAEFLADRDEEEEPF